MKRLELMSFQLNISKNRKYCKKDDFGMINMRILNFQGFNE